MSEKKIPYKIYLEESEMPKTWYNVRADMKNKPAPLLNPETFKPMTEEELSVVFCEELVKQELDNENRYIEIPEKIRDFYKMYRPAPLIRAYCLEEKLQTPAKIYYKFEGNNTSGSHKLNSAIAQAYYAKDQGLKGVTTETGAGQWGTALSMACSYLDLDCKVYMVKCSYEQKPFRREVMRTYGASVTPSPSETTEVGRKILAEHPGTSGSLGCAISEAVEVATHTPGYRYVLGSVLNQVLLHQSVIGVESKIAMDKYGIKPDIIIGCAGGGSNLGGLISPFMGEKLRGEADYQFIAVEPASCPSLTRGVYAYDYCDTGMVCPLSKMYTLGSGFIPSASHAGGLRYHGMSSVLSQLYEDGYMEARSVEQTEVFKAAEKFARVEGILPAPESSHAIKVAIDEALKCKETGEEKTIFFGLTGTGYFDMYAYEKFHDGKMSDYIPSDEELKEAQAAKEAEIEAELGEKKDTLKAEIEALKQQKQEIICSINAEAKARENEIKLTRSREEDEYTYNLKRSRKAENDKWEDEKAAREKILELRETAALEKETELNAKADHVKELEAKVEEIPTLIAAATEEGIKKGKADADKSNAFEVRALKKDAEYQKQLLEDKNERLAEDLANARAEKVELQQKLDDAYAQMRELAAKTVESTGGVKILNGQTQQNNK